MSIRVLGIDPGLTRCGVGIVDVLPNRKATLVEVGVIRTPTSLPLAERLLAVSTGIDDLLDRFSPDAVAVERVFAQQNLRTVMGTAQVSGVALLAAARRSLPVGLHTPSEVKASITGYGSADKKQVAAMVMRVLRLAESPTPADASDALAIAICHAWRQGVASTAGLASPGIDGLTSAQKAWITAERVASKTPSRAAPRRAGGPGSLPMSSADPRLGP